MLDKKKISMKMSPEVRKVLENRISSCGLEKPILNFSWARWSDEKEQHLFLAFYEFDLLPVNDPIRIIIVEDIEIVIIQDWLCDVFEGKLMDIENHRFVLKNPKTGVVIPIIEPNLE